MRLELGAEKPEGEGGRGRCSGGPQESGVWGAQSQRAVGRAVLEEGNPGRVGSGPELGD